MTCIALAPIRGSATQATKRLTVPLNAQAFERDGLGAPAGAFLSRGNQVLVSVRDGKAVAAEVGAIAKKVEAFLLNNPGARWRFPSVDPDDGLGALLEPEKTAPPPDFSEQLLDHEPEVRPEAGMLPQSEWRAIAVEDGVPEAVAASRKARANPTHHFISISPTPALHIRTRWAVLLLNATATAADLSDYEKRVAFYLKSDIVIRAYVPIGMHGTERFKQRCQALEKTARAEGKRGDRPAQDCRSTCSRNKATRTAQR